MVESRYEKDLKQARNFMERLGDRIQKDYPIGSPITWEPRHRSVAQGQVVDYGGAGRLKVRNEATGKEYWIAPYAILKERHAKDGIPLREAIGGGEAG